MCRRSISSSVSTKMAVFLSLIFMILSSATACDRCVHQAKAAFFSKDAALSCPVSLGPDNVLWKNQVGNLHSNDIIAAGACGYGSLALGFNGGHLAAGAPSLFKKGAGCGACFQIRCKDGALCRKAGTKIVLTDLNRSNRTDFVLSSRAFRAMASEGMDRKLLGFGIVDVEYKRVPCDYSKKQNLAVRVEEGSKRPNYLAIKVLYVGGQTEIVAMDVAETGDSPNWAFMSRNYGAVWDTSRAPEGPVQFRFVVTAGYDGKYIWAKNVLPADWKPGVIYDTGVRITDVAQEGCSPCDDGGQWRK